MSETKSSYRQVFKATSIFGGVQVFTILITIIRSKVVAVLLGPAGMGIAGLLSSTLDMIGALTNFGLNTSSVKNIAAASSTGDMKQVSKVAAVLKRLVWITGTFGLLATLLLSPWLSELTFGNRDYTVAFILLSVTLLMNQLAVGQSVLMRGLRQIRLMVKSGVIGSVIGLITTIPLYYFFREKGIVWAIIATSLSSLLLNLYFARKIRIEKLSVDKATTIAQGRDMIRMGFILSLSGIITLTFSYIVKIFISKNGGVNDLGLYNAGFAIISSYVGLIFAAMATDYYPRLSGVANDVQKTNESVNHQAEIAILILAPVLILFLVYIDWAVILLYSNKFLGINQMMHWAAVGILFKAASWSIGFIFLAKGATKVFFWSELVANGYIVLLNLAGYKYWGLTGLGVSFFVAYFLLLIQVFGIAKKYYAFNFSRAFFKIFSIQFLLVIGCFLTVSIIGHPWDYLTGTILFFVSLVYSYEEMDKRIGMQGIFQNIKGRLKKK